MRTLAPIWKAVVTSLERLRSGVRGYKFQLYELRGDWKHHQETIGLVNHWRCNAICHRCGASKQDGALRYWDFVDSPCWRHTVRSLLQFYLEQVDLASPYCNALLLATSFHYRRIRVCLMHAVNLGVGMDSNGACLRVLCDMQWFGAGSIDAKFTAAWLRFRAWLKTNKVQCSQPRFKTWMLHQTTEDFCLLKTKERSLTFVWFCTARAQT